MYCTKCGSSIPDDAQLCPNCGENLEEAKTLLKEAPAFLDDKKEEILKFIQKKNFHDVVKVLEQVLNKVKQEDISNFYSFFKEVLLTNPQLFESKKFYRNYLNSLSRQLTSDQLCDMETYLIDNICTYEDEKVAISTIGRLFYLDWIFSGRIYITDLRIIVIGVRTKNYDFTPNQIRAMAKLKTRGILTSLFDGISVKYGFSTSTAVYPWQRRQTGRILREKSKIQPLVKFGYQFPIKESFVKYEKNMIRFESSFTDYGETVRILFNFVTSPRMGEKDEEYLKRVRQLLKEIEELKKPKVIRAFQPSKLKPFF